MSQNEEWLLVDCFYSSIVKSDKSNLSLFLVKASSTIKIAEALFIMALPTVDTSYTEVNIFSLKMA